MEDRKGCVYIAKDGTYFRELYIPSPKTGKVRKRTFKGKNEMEVIQKILKAKALKYISQWYLSLILKKEITKSTHNLILLYFITMAFLNRRLFYYKKLRG